MRSTAVPPEVQEEETKAGMKPSRKRDRRHLTVAEFRGLLVSASAGEAAPCPTRTEAERRNRFTASQLQPCRPGSAGLNGSSPSGENESRRSRKSRRQAPGKLHVSEGLFMLASHKESNSVIQTVVDVLGASVSTGQLGCLSSSGAASGESGVTSRWQRSSPPGGGATAQLTSY